VLITVLPRNYSFEGSRDKSIMSAAQEAGFRWPTICAGNAECGVCFIRLADEDLDALSPMTEVEKAGLEMVLPRFPQLAPGTLRLACQARPRRPVRVHKLGVKPEAT
jgi:ferredoxin, 2Fe-2S